jgi:ABC-2 type transport system permease protein
MTSPVPAASTAPAASSALPQRLPSIPALLAGQVRYQLKILTATPAALVIGIGLPVILLVASQSRHSGKAGLAMLAGYAIFGLTMTAFNTHGIRLIMARESGILRRWRVSPIPPWCYFISQIAASALFAVFTGAATFVLGMLLYGTHITGTGVVLGLVALLLGAVAWAALATALTGLVPRAEVAQPVFILVYFPTLILSGSLGGISDLPHWLVTLVSYLPAKPLVSAVTHGLGAGAAGPSLPARDIIMMLAWAVGGLLLAVALFRWDPHRPVQRRAART